jgi:asparagine N-glycosylation enzyme membrane subunit Stt3
MNKERLFLLLRRYWPVIALILIVFLSFTTRLIDYRWPYLRNIDSYTFYRQMDEIIHNNGVLPEYDNLVVAPDGTSRAGGQFFYVYVGAYSYMFFHIFFPDMLLWQFLIWFPPLLISLAAIPMYFIGKILFDRRAGILAAFFYVFDISIVSRSLGGDPDSDCIVLLLPIIIMASFLLTYKFINAKKAFNKRALLYSIITGIFLGLWGHTWGGYWFVVWLITGFFIMKFLIGFISSRKIRHVWHDMKHQIFSYIIMILVFFSLTIPFFGAEYIPGTFLNTFNIWEIKEETGREFPNVYVSVQEMQSPSDARDVIQKTSAIDFNSNPIAMLISPFFLMIYSLLYLAYSYIRKRQHLDTIILLLIWFLGPFAATLISVRFSILFSAPIAIGSAILLSKLFRMITIKEKLED